MNNRIAQLLTAFAVLSCAELFAVNVSTVTELKTALSGNDTEIVLASGTYALTSQLDVTRAVTIRGATGNPADVILDGKHTYRVFDLNNANAVIRDLTIYRGKNGSLSQHGGGIRIGANGGTVDNCIFDSCKLNHNTSSYGGSAVYIPAGGVVRNCVIKDSVDDANAAISYGLGVYVNGGTLENCLVRGSKRTAYVDHTQGKGAVYLASGTVKNCTITGNDLSDSALQVADNASAIVIDTISWGNIAKQVVSTGAPNVNVAGSKPTITNLYTDHPALNDDYTLSPASPCIGAGVNGGDLGWKPYDATADKLGISVSAENGVDSLSVTAKVVGSGAYANISSVTWDGLAETGTEITHTFGPGVYTLTAQVTLSDSTVKTVSLNGTITVKSTGFMTVDANHSFDDLFPIAGNGSTIYIPNNTIQLNKTCYYIKNNIKIIGESRDGTVLKRKNGGRFFCFVNGNAEVSNLTMDGVNNGWTLSGEGGGVWMKNGGVISNCVVKSCAVSASKSAGGILMSNSKALVTHSLIMNNKAGGNSGKGAGIYLNYGTVADCLIISNSTASTSGTSLLGGGIYMGTETANAKVVNCTVAKNSAYSGGGIYRVGDAGYVYNTIVYGNTCNAAGAQFVSENKASKPARNTVDAVKNCASPTGVGSSAQTLTAAPYVLPYYELSGSVSGQLIDNGDSSLAVSATDYAGNARIFGSSVDIGCYENSQSAVAVGFSVDKVTSTGSDDYTFTAQVTGAELADCTFAWYLDGSGTAAGSGSEYTGTLNVGRHSMRLVVTIGGSNYESVQENLITVYPTDIYCNVASQNAQWPFDAPGIAASNLNEAVKTALGASGTLHLAAGEYLVTNTVSLTGSRRILGAGREVTMVKRSPSKNELRVFRSTGPAYTSKS